MITVKLLNIGNHVTTVKIPVINLRNLFCIEYCKKTFLNLDFFKF